MEKTYRYSTRKQKSVSYLEPTYSELDDTANESDEDDIKPKKRVKLSKQFHFLKLPQEIQDKVHRYALVPARGVALALEGSELNQKLIRSSYRLQGRVVTLPYYGLSRWERRSLRWTEQLATALLRTSQKIYEDATRVLYSQPLAFQDTAVLAQFLATIRPNSAHLLKHIIIQIHNPSRQLGLGHPSLTALVTAAPYIQTIYFDVLQVGNRVSQHIFYHDATPIAAQMAKATFKTCMGYIKGRVYSELYKKHETPPPKVINTFDFNVRVFSSFRPSKRDRARAEADLKQKFRRQLTILIQKHIDKSYLRITASGEA